MAPGLLTVTYPSFWPGSTWTHASKITSTSPNGPSRLSQAYFGAREQNAPFSEKVSRAPSYPWNTAQTHRGGCITKQGVPLHWAAHFLSAKYTKNSSSISLVYRNPNLLRESNATFDSTMTKVAIQCFDSTSVVQMNIFTQLKIFVFFKIL